MEVGTVPNQVASDIRKDRHLNHGNNERGRASFSSEIVIFERTEIETNFTFYNKNGKSATQEIAQPETKTVETSDNVNVVQLREKIHNEILAQVKEFLASFFDKNPEAVEQISKGEIPEYFNVDNTARRILNIYFSRFEEGQNKEEFVARAKDIINQAYGDVQGLVGDLPEIVQQTRAKVMEILDMFAGGGDISEFMQSQFA